MSRTTTMLTAAAAAALASSAAFARVVPVGLVNVPISAAALAADPTLAGYSTYDLQVSIDAGDHWAGASSRMDLHGTGGAFYTPAAFDADTGVSQFASVFANLAFDTFVTKPVLDPNNISIPGGSNSDVFPGSRPTATMPQTGNDRQLFDITWGDTGATNNPATGVQTIARLTIAKTAGSLAPAFIIGKVTGTANPSESNFFSYNLPEPTSLAVMSLGLGVVGLRRRSK
jgi:hypothetical protein